MNEEEQEKNNDDDVSPHQKTTTTQEKEEDEEEGRLPVTPKEEEDVKKVKDNNLKTNNPPLLSGGILITNSPSSLSLSLSSKAKRKIARFDGTKDNCIIIVDSNSNDNVGDAGENNFYDSYNNYDDIINNNEDDNDDDEMKKKNKIYTENSPPGPKAFVDWFTSTSADCNAHDANDDIERNKNDELINPSTIAVRNFMGPFDDSLAEKFRYRRNQKNQSHIRQRQVVNKNQNKNKNKNHNKSNSNDGITHPGAHPSYSCASYKVLDTLVSQQYAYSLAKLHKEEERIHEEEKMKLQQQMRRTTRISVLPVVISGPQQNKRLFAGMIRWLITFPTARKRTKNNPIGAYQQEILYWTRLVLILVGLVSATVIWCIVYLSELLLVTKNDFVTNPIQYNNNYNYTIFSSSNTNMTNLSTSNFLTDGFGDVNVTAASDAATDFVINNGAGNGTNYYGLSSFAYFIGFNMLFTFLAFIPVAYRPVSGGSGIAEAKATLNGIILPTCTDLLTACCKAVSVIFAGAASLPIGLEGPLIFIGLAIGHNAQRFIPNSYNQLKLDEMKRDFAVVGCACGVAGAFLTPIGGVLFAMEEGASFWSALLAWRSFAAACVTTITLYVLDWVLALIKAAISGEDTTNEFFNVHDMAIYSGLPGQRSLSSLSINNDADLYFKSVPSFRVYDFLLFAVIGILAGIVGSLWIEANSYITTLRRRVGLNRVGKLIELLTLSILTTCIFWFLPLLYTRCTAMEAIQTIDTSILRQMNCPDGYYNQLGTLFLNPPGGIGLNLLYWEDGIEAFDAGPLAIAGFTYHILLLLLFGTSTAMGIFIPLLFAGACYGRAFGVMIIYHTDFFPDDGVSGHREAVMTTYTMVCSVALLAGVVRVLISLTVIMVCSIGVTYLVTPFMVATLFAKVVGKAMFGRPGIYDVIIETRGMPFLETECPKNVIMRGLCAKDIMSRPLLVALEPEQRIGQLLEYLRRNPDFDDYPVIDSSHGGILLGVITKRDILTLLSHRELFYQPQKEEMANNDSGNGGGDGDGDHDDGGGIEATMPPPLLGTKQKSQRVALNFDQLIYERVKKVDVDIDTVLNIITEEDRDKVLDVTPYLEIGHYTVNQFVSVHRTFQLFRSLGLRYLIVTDAFGRPIGVITRHDLKLLEDVGMDEEQYVRRLSELSLNNEIDTSYRS